MSAEASRFLRLLTVAAYAIGWLIIAIYSAAPYLGAVGVSVTFPLRRIRLSFLNAPWRWTAATVLWAASAVALAGSCALILMALPHRVAAAPSLLGLEAVALVSGLAAAAIKGWDLHRSLLASRKRLQAVSKSPLERVSAGF